jgi:NADH-quinone oxidoreductase subunit L
MGGLALLAIGGGIVSIPGVTEWLNNFLEPTFADSKYIHDLPSTAADWTGLIVGAGIAVAGITTAFVMYLQRPGITIALRDRFPRLHDFLEHKWYFDELYDALFVRPTVTFGRFGRYVIESAFVQGTLVGGATGIVRAGASIARGVQSGYLRAYALLLLAGVAAVGLYFLLQST